METFERLASIIIHVAIVVIGSANVVTLVISIMEYGTMIMKINFCHVDLNNIV